MEFEGTTEIFRNLFTKQRRLTVGDPAHTEIRPMLMGLGGNMRGIYSAAQSAVLEEYGLIDIFDYLVGVSTSAPLAVYCLAGQASLVSGIYLEEGRSRKFLSPRRALIGGLPVDLDYAASVFRGATGKTLDQAAARRSRTQIRLAVTHAETGESLLIDPKQLPDMVEAIRASIAIPGSSRVIGVAGIPALDGSIGSPMPIREACRQFAPTDVLILANRRENDVSSSVLQDWFTRRRSRTFTKPFLRALERQEERFREELVWLREQPRLRYGIIWSDGNVRAMTRHWHTLISAEQCAGHDMRSHLMTAGL